MVPRATQGNVGGVSSRCSGPPPLHVFSLLVRGSRHPPRSEGDRLAVGLLIAIGGRWVPSAPGLVGLGALVAASCVALGDRWPALVEASARTGRARRRPPDGQPAGGRVTARPVGPSRSGSRRPSGAARRLVDRAANPILAEGSQQPHEHVAQQARRSQRRERDGGRPAEPWWERGAGRRASRPQGGRPTGWARSRTARCCGSPRPSRARATSRSRAWPAAPGRAGTRRARQSTPTSAPVRRQSRRPTNQIPASTGKSLMLAAKAIARGFPIVSRSVTSE